MRGMKTCIKGAVFVSAWLGLSASAFAQADPKINVTLKQLVPTEVDGVGKVSQSRTSNNGNSFLSQVTYRFDIGNGGSSNLNRTFLDLTLNNPGGSEFPTVHDVVTTVPTATCTFTPNVSISLNCQFGTLAPGGGAVTAYVIVNVPSNGSVLEASWRGGGYEGNGGNNGCCQPFGTYTTQMVDKLTDQSYKYTLQTFVKKEGTELFTGDQAIPKPAKGGQAADLNTTLAVVPVISATYPTDPTAIEKYAGKIFEKAESCTASSFKSNMCYDSEITIEALDFSKGGAETEVAIDLELGQTVAGQDELLDVVLRVDQSVLKNGAKIDDFKLYYEGVEVPACSNFTPYVTTRTNLPAGTLVRPTSTLPCYTEKTILKGAGVPTDAKGDLQVKAKHYKNGTWRLL